MRGILARLVVTGALIAGGLTAVAAVPAAAAPAPPAVVDATTATPLSATQDWEYLGRFATHGDCASAGILEVRYTSFTTYKCVYQPMAAYYFWYLYATR